jgi:hypothetical protein
MSFIGVEVSWFHLARSGYEYANFNEYSIPCNGIYRRRPCNSFARSKSKTDFLVLLWILDSITYNSITLRQTLLMRRRTFFAICSQVKTVKEFSLLQLAEQVALITAVLA